MNNFIYSWSVTSSLIIFYNNFYDNIVDAFNLLMPCPRSYYLNYMLCVQNQAIINESSSVHKIHTNNTIRNKQVIVISMYIYFESMCHYEDLQLKSYTRNLSYQLFCLSIQRLTM